MKQIVLSIAFLLLLSLHGTCQNTGMQQQLATLDKLIKTVRPKYYASLNAPLTTAQISALEKKYKVKLPDDLKMLYQWKNGQKATCYDAFINNSTFMPLEQALTSAAELTGMIGTDFDIKNWWNESWIPVFENGGGDHICYDKAGIFTKQPGQIIEYWHADKDRNVIAPSLQSFIAVLNKYYESTDPAKFDKYFDVGKSIEGYPKMFKVE